MHNGNWWVKAKKWIVIHKLWLCFHFISYSHLCLNCVNSIYDSYYCLFKWNAPQFHKWIVRPGVSYTENIFIRYFYKVCGQKCTNIFVLYHGDIVEFKKTFFNIGIHCRSYKSLRISYFLSTIIEFRIISFCYWCPVPMFTS